MIRVVRGDLVAAAVECILRPIRSDGEAVTALGRRLEAAAGDEVIERLAAMGESPVGTALLTPAGALRSSFLVHVVLQSVEEPVNESALRRGLVNALRRASDFGIESLALPPLGVVAGALEAEEMARVVVEVLRDHLAEGAAPTSVEIVVESEYEESIFAAAVGAAGRGGA